MILVSSGTFYGASDVSENDVLRFFLLQAVLWNMENFQTQYTPEEHALIITDVRFRPNSSQLATSSFDRTIKLWNAADVSQFAYPLQGPQILCYYPSYSNVTIILLHTSLVHLHAIKIWSVFQYSWLQIQLYLSILSPCFKMQQGPTMT